LKGEQDRTELRRFFLQFKLPTLPRGATVNKAFLSLYAYPGDPATQDISVHRVITSWTPSIKWLSQPAVEYNNAVDMPVTSNTQIMWDITEIVSGWVSGVYTNNGLLVCAKNEAGLAMKTFYSNTCTNLDFAPRLEMSYFDGAAGTPEQLDEQVPNQVVDQQVPDQVVDQHVPDQVVDQQVPDQVVDQQVPDQVVTSRLTINIINPNPGGTTVARIFQ